MSRRIAIVGLMFAWLCANGMLWDAMQFAAWGKMFATYSEAMPVAEALRETLDPAKPCKMCLGIAKARSATDNPMPAVEENAVNKLVLAIHTVDPPVFANAPGDWPGSPSLAGAERTYPVPLPPPRV